MWKIKKGQETFTVVDGPDAGKTFEKDVEYDQVPASEKQRFEKVKLGVANTAKAPEKKRSK